MKFGSEFLITSHIIIYTQLLIFSDFIETFDIIFLFCIDLCFIDCKVHFDTIIYVSVISSHCVIDCVGCDVGII